MQILPGAGSLAEPNENIAAEEIFEQLDRLKAGVDFVIVDLGTGVHRVLRSFVTMADRVLIVTTPEPPSIADAYAIIKSLSPADEPKWEVLINQAESSSQADQIYQRLKQTTRLFLRKELELAGSVPRDSHVAAKRWRCGNRSSGAPALFGGSRGETARQAAGPSARKRPKAPPRNSSSFQSLTRPIGIFSPLLTLNLIFRPTTHRFFKIPRAVLPANRAGLSNQKLSHSLLSTTLTLSPDAFVWRVLLKRPLE